MDPFAANIGFLMMECDEAPMERVMTFHQEKAVKLPNCDELACDWQTFKETYAVRTSIFKLCIRPNIMCKLFLRMTSIANLKRFAMTTEFH